MGKLKKAKIVGVREAKATLSEIVDNAQKQRVILTRHGQPAAVVVGVEGMDLEDLLLATDAEFWRDLEARRAHPGESVTLDEYDAGRAKSDPEYAKLPKRRAR